MIIKIGPPQQHETAQAWVFVSSSAVTVCSAASMAAQGSLLEVSVNGVSCAKDMCAGGDFEGSFSQGSRADGG